MKKTRKNDHSEAGAYDYIETDRAVDANKKNMPNEPSEKRQKVAFDVTKPIYADGRQPEDPPAQKKKKEKKKWSGTKKAVVFSVLGVIAIALGGGIAFVLGLLNDPMAQFDTIKEQVQDQVSAELPEPGDSSSGGMLTVDGSVAGETDLTPEELLALEADMSMLNENIVNILLIGVDYSDERLTEEWINGGAGKTEWHTDVMIVLAIDTVENTVDMISLPRDTYANIPGVEGYYKLNSAINCGGAYPEPEALDKVVEAAEWMLGGNIPIDYYYAVTMPGVKNLVDNTVGFVEYDVHSDFTIGGRPYKEGVQMLSGQGVLDNIRVRKSGEDQGDLNRINRQKDLLVAIFETMKEEGMWTQIPALFDLLNEDIVTNTNLAQMAALALFANDLDSENIVMHSMDGPTYSMFDGWVYCFTDQEDRVELIKEVYGVTVPEYEEYTLAYAAAEYSAFIKDNWVATAQAMLDADAELLEQYGLNPDHTPIDPDAVVTPGPGETTDPGGFDFQPIGVTIAQTQTQTQTETPTPTATPTPTITIPVGCIELEHRLYFEQLLATIAETEPGLDLLDMLYELRDTANAVYEDLHGTKLKWTTGITNDNEVDVDFR